MNNNQEKPVKLDGFAPAAGTGAAGSTSMAAPPAAASTSTVAAAAAAAITAGGGAGTAEPIPAKKPAKKIKKRAPKKNGAASGASSENDSANLSEETVLRPLSEVGPKFEPLSLPQIQLRIKTLLEKLPTVLPEIPPNYDPETTAATTSVLHAPVKSFASIIQITIEEYNLLLSLVSAATYRWGVDRSGASQQNLGVMSAELQQCQEVISNVVSARLSNVLCPAVDLLVGEIEIVRDEGGENNGEGGSSAAIPAKKRKLNEDRLVTTKNTNYERRINHYKRPLVDPSYVHLCHCILARNAHLVRHSVATSVHTAQRVIGDYLNAMKKDSGHEDSKGGYY